MRLPILASLLLSAVVAAGAGGCSSAGGASPDDFAPTSDDQIISTTNPMGLRLVYDESSSHVHATVRSKLATGEKLVMRIRRGRFTPGDAAMLDCGSIAEAPPLPAAAGASAYAKVVYDGPQVDRSLLASVYSQDWIDANISQDVLERLSRDGSDSIVEACIIAAAPAPDGAAPATAMAMAAPATAAPAMAIPAVPTANGGANARIRVQTSIQDAWDSSDPNMAPALRARNRAAAAAAR